MRIVLPPALLLLLIACPSADESTREAPPAERPPALVEVVQATAPTLDRTFELLGEVRSRHHAELAVGADGPVVRLDALEGEYVPAGRLLLRIDDAVARAEQAAAVAAAAETRVELQRAESELSRYERVDPSLLAGSELDDVRAAVDRLRARLTSQEARVALTEAVMGRHRILAPFDGVITRRHADPGDWITPGRVVLELAGTTDLDVLVDVPGELATALKPGDEATLSRRGRAAVEAVVRGVVPVLDPDTRTARVRLAPRGSLLPGESVRVAFDVTSATVEGAAVPRDAVIDGPRGKRVFAVIDGKAVPATVTVLMQSPDALIVSGVEPGASIVVRGNERLQSDQAVRIVGEG